jgi:hypothetical protein
VTSGVYYPQVGLYDFATLDRLPVVTDGQAEAADSYRLPPVKVVGPAPAPPTHAQSYSLGNLARLEGYDLAPDPAVVAPGDALTLTLHYHVIEPAGQDLTRFLQLYSPIHGVLAQHDGPPSDGANPTWSWVQNERLLDTITIVVPPNAPAGVYGLYTGLYNPGDGNARLAVRTQEGASVPENWAYLAAVEVSAP